MIGAQTGDKSIIDFTGILLFGPIRTGNKILDWFLGFVKFLALMILSTKIFVVLDQHKTNGVVAVLGFILGLFVFCWAANTPAQSFTWPKSAER